jgi:glycerol-3-phosphate cytidylyltransferase
MSLAKQKIMNSNGGRKIVGYTAGVYDLFHIGHVNLLRNARSMCDHLIVGVSTDELVRYKHKTPVIPYCDRVEVVRACRYADTVVPQEDMDKLKAWEKLKFDIMFVGDDWFNTDKWREIESQLGQRGVRIVYFPYTKNVSSTAINSILEKKRQEIGEGLRPASGTSDTSNLGQ